jgi:formate-dependent nitrite reductase membrane component NrfD
VIAVPLYVVTVTACKISILCLYRRIFSTPAFLRLTLLFGILIVAWGVAALPVGIFICVPPRRFWKPAVPGHCNNFGTAFIILETVEIVLDFAQLVLPVHMIFTLNLTRRNKIVLSLIFLSGGL